MRTTESHKVAGMALGLGYVKRTHGGNAAAAKFKKAREGAKAKGINTLDDLTTFLTAEGFSPTEIADLIKDFTVLTVRWADPDEEHQMNAWKWIHFPAPRSANWSNPVVAGSRERYEILGSVARAGSAADAMLGLGLHSLQDAFSHETRSASTGHAFAAGVDDPWGAKAPTSVRMAEATLDALVEYGGGTALAAKDRADVMANLLKIFTDSKSKKDVNEAMIKVIEDKYGKGTAPKPPTAAPTGFSDAVDSLNEHFK